MKLKNKILKRHQIKSIDIQVPHSTNLFSSGRLFRIRGALMGNPKSPLDLNLDFETARRAPPEDLKLQHFCSVARGET